MTRRVHPHTDCNADLNRSPRSSFPWLTAAPGSHTGAPKPTCYLGAVAGRPSTLNASEKEEGPFPGGKMLVGFMVPFWGCKSTRARQGQGQWPWPGMGSLLPRAGAQPHLPVAKEHPGNCLQIPPLHCHSSWRWRSGVNHCLLLIKAFTLLQFHHILNSWAAHAASQLLDLEGRQPHAHGWTRTELAWCAGGWQLFPSRSVPDINDRNK